MEPYATSPFQLGRYSSLSLSLSLGTQSGSMEFGGSGRKGEKESETEREREREKDRHFFLPREMSPGMFRRSHPRTHEKKKKKTRKVGNPLRCFFFF